MKVKLLIAVALVLTGCVRDRSSPTPAQPAPFHDVIEAVPIEELP